jgi:hypothetical protein
LHKEQLLAGDGGLTAQALDRELAAAREKLARANRRFMLEIEEPTKEDRAAFEAVRCEMGARIRELGSQQAQLQLDAAALPRLRNLHARLTTTELGDLIDQLLQAGGHVPLRDLLVDLIDSAVLAERYPASRSTWLRMEVRWSADVQTLLSAVITPIPPHPAR